MEGVEEWLYAVPLRGGILGGHEKDENWRCGSQTGCVVIVGIGEGQW